MTRQEFQDEVIGWGDLIDWCNDNGCDVCDEIYYEDSYNDYIDEQILEWARGSTWEDLKDTLNDLPTGYEYYYRSDYAEWRGLDDSDFDDFFNEVLVWGDDNDMWDNGEEECAEEDPDDEDDENIEKEDFSFDELFSVCNSTIQTISKERAEAEAEAEAEFDEFMLGVVAVVEGRV